MRQARKSKAEFFQNAAEEYMRIKKVAEFDPDDVADWLVETGQFHLEAWGLV